jgi:hypothetical protein
VNVTASPTAVSARIDRMAAHVLITRHPFRWWELLPWLASIGFYFALPDYLGFGAELLVAILFALSLDLALGYAGIITLGHANISSTPVGGEARRVVVVREWWGAPLRGPLRRVAHSDSRLEINHASRLCTRSLEGTARSAFAPKCLPRQRGLFVGFRARRTHRLTVVTVCEFLSQTTY